MLNNLNYNKNYKESINLTKSGECTFLVLSQISKNLGIDFIDLAEDIHLDQNCLSIIPFLCNLKINSYKSIYARII